MPAHESRAVYSVQEVAAMLNLSRGSTYAGLQSGEIPALRIGTRWVIPKQSFHAWLNGNRASGGDL